MRLLIGLSLTAGLSVAALAAGNPDWAYPVGPPPAGTPDAVTMKTVPGSNRQYTMAQITNRFGPADWFPSEHPPMPGIVAHGGQKPTGFACALCHLPSGDGHPESADLAGLPASYIVRQMTTFKHGERTDGRAPVMIAEGQLLSDDEVKDAADYYAARTPTAGYYTVTETETVPKSHVGGGAMRVSLPGGGTEPIGDRIIALPKNDTEALLHDPHSGFIDYVPKGSIGWGETLATTGGGGKTVACSVCHGPNLEGMGEAPPIAGREATYIFRQLNDMQRGTRKGAAVDLMKPAVAKLTENDMIALAAYLESRHP